MELVRAPRHPTTQEMVGEFYERFGLPDRREQGPRALSSEEANLRIDLQNEEVGELVAAFELEGIVEIADALADIVYVAYGTALQCGIDLDPVLREVHRSSMTKLDARGNPIRRSDGKILKSDRYEPPNVVGCLDAQWGV